MDQVDVLDQAYRDLCAIITELDEPASWRPTACAGWAVRDLVLHLLGDAQRALLALATPASRPADRDSTTYWLDSPGAPDAESREIRSVRTIASAWALRFLTASYAETTAAVVTLARRTPAAELVATQGHVLRAEDLVITLVVEAVIHHLDLIADLDRPGPGERPLALVRTTLDGLLGRPAPQEWSDREWALLATGRCALTEERRAELGADAARLPLLR